MEFRILGPLEVHDTDGPLPVTIPRTRTVLAVLLTYPNTVVSVDYLVDELWPQWPPERARAQVHDYMSRLRGMLRQGTGAASTRLATRKPGYVLRVDDTELDADRFDALLRQATEAHAAGRLDRSLYLYAEADRAWRGEPLTDVPSSPRISATAAALTEQRLTGLEQRYQVALDTGGGSDLVAELTAQVHAYPLRERLVAHLMKALYRGGRTAEALAVHRRTRKHLDDELGLTPGPELRQLESDILREEPHLLSGSGPSPQHALPPPAELPADLPGFTGRDRELSALETGEATTSDGGATTGGVRVVHGMAGIGKTSLAVRAAHRLAHRFPDGQLFVELHGFSPQSAPLEPGDALNRMLRALGTPGESIPHDTAGRAALFRSRLADRRVLVMLDNAADESQVQPLLPGASGCLTLITSRRRLTGLDTARSLGLETLAHVDATALFTRSVGPTTQVTQAAAPDLRHVVELCGRLPLAIRIAAARLRRCPDWTVADIVDRLQEGLSRLDTLRAGERSLAAAFELSYRDLPSPQRRLFRQLGRLGCSEFPAWLGDALLDGDAEHALEEIADAHLVEPAGRGVTGPRYRMHDLVGLFAGDKAQEAGDEPETMPAIDRVGHGWLALARSADNRLPHWTGLDPEPTPRWAPHTRVVSAVRDSPMSWFDNEQTHLDAQIRRAAGAGDAAVCWPLAQRMATYLDIRGRHEQLHLALTHGLRAAERADDPQGRAAMLGRLADTAANRDDYLGALAYGDRALEAYKALYPDGAAAPPQPPDASAAGSPAAFPHDLGLLRKELADARSRADTMAVGLFSAEIALAQRRAGVDGDFLGLFEEARDAFHAGGPPILEAWALKHIAQVYCRRGRVDLGEASMRRIHDILRELGTDIDPTYLGGDLAGIALAHGRTREARIVLQESTRLARLRNDPWSTGRGLITLGRLLHDEGERATALAVQQEALTIWRDLGVPARITQVLASLAELCAAAGDEDAAAAYRAAFCHREHGENVPAG